MQQHELRPPRGAKTPRKRVGRGNASGNGTYAGKGVKGQQARAGSGPRIGFEGGQTPLIRRLPTRRGFNNPFRVEYQPVNLRDLSRLPAGSDVTPDSLRNAGIVHSAAKPIKLLADGDLTSALTVRVHRVSASARNKIESAGGSVEELTPRRSPEQRRQRKHLRVAKTEPAAVSEPPAGEAETEPEATGEAPAEEEGADGSDS